MVIHAHKALVDGQIASRVAVRVDAGGEILEVRPATADDPPPLAGLLVPGLVNAHLHLELSWAHGHIPGGERLPHWVRTLQATTPPADARDRAAAAAEGMARGGTALVCDVSNAGDTAPLLDDAGLVGIVQHEILGFGPGGLPDRIARAEAAVSHHGGIAVRPSPHGVYSTPGDLIRAAAAPRGGVPATIHVAEDPAEASFTMYGTGAFADLIDAIGVDWRWQPIPGASPVGWLSDLGVLGPDLLLVHGVHLSEEDRRRIAQSGAPLCLCPRSNLHIGGTLPDVPALLRAGVALCLGTDSLASSPDLDVLGEVAALIRAFPDVDAVTWLVLATAGGADALMRPDLGRIAVGASPGLLLLEGVDEPADLRGSPTRRWIVAPGGVA